MDHVTTKREIHKAIIPALVRKLGQLSRIQMHELTQLRRNTISQLVRELLQEGKLLEAGLADNPLGRKQVLLRLNEEYGFVVGLEFDAEFVVAAVMDLHPRIRATVKEGSYLGGGIDGLLKQLLSCTRRVIQQAGLELRSVLGIGIVDPGLINSREGVSVMSSTIGFWKQVPLKKIFEETFTIPCLLGNSCRTKALAERVLGAGEMAEDMIYVEYTRGIGAGMIMGGRILEGHRWSAGELGHVQVIENGPPCTCGGFGCLEALVGAGALEARIRTALQAGSNSRILDLVGGDLDEITAWKVFEAARMGDKTCSAIVEQLGRYLGMALANLINLFNPSMIVLDQHLELTGPPLLDQIIRIIRRQALSDMAEQLTVRFGKLDATAGVLGAGLLVLEKLFEIPALRPLQFMRELPPAPSMRGSP